MSEWRVVGHARAVRLLQGMIRRGRVAHAYVLAGPAHCGKTTLAREFAKALNCEGEDPPCQVCGPCRRIEAREDFDVVEISVRPDKQRIQIDQVREFHRRSALTATGAKYKVAIVTQAELMSAEAANAFLKTLEEPPPRTVMLLATPRLSLLPATVVSRCVEISLGPVELQELRKLLRERGTVTAEDEEMVLEYAEGMAGWAVEMITNSERLEECRAMLKDWKEVLEGSATARVLLVDRLASNRTVALEALNVLARYYAVVARRGWGATESPAPANHPPPSEVGAWVQNVSVVRKAMRALAANTLVRPTLEDMMISVKAPPAPL